MMAGQSTTTTREPAAVWRSPPPLAVWAGTWGGRSGHMRHPAAVAKTPTGGAERAATAPKHSAKARHNTQNNRRQCVRAASGYCAEKTTAGPARAVGCRGPINWVNGDCYPKPLRLDARNHQDSPLWGGRGRGASALTLRCRDFGSLVARAAAIVGKSRARPKTAQTRLEWSRDFRAHSNF